MRLVSIVRVSTTGQDTEGQRPANEAWAKQNGHVITRTVEIKASAYKLGTNGRRTPLDKALDDVISERPDGILMRRVDRLSRQGMERGLATVRKIRTAGVRLFLSDYGDAAEMDELMLGALFYVARKESETKAARTFDNRRVMASRNAWSGVAPFGYDVADSGTLNARLVVNEAEAELVRELFERCAAGESLRDLARWACSLRFSQATPKGKNETRLWQPANSQMQKLLAREAYATGRTQLTSTPRDRDGNELPADSLHWHHDHEPIITRELWQRATDARLGRRSKEDYSRDNTLVNLEGAIRCAKCDGKMYVATQRKKTGKIYKRYQCRVGHGMTMDKCEALVQEIMTKETGLFVTNIEVAESDGDRVHDDEIRIREELASLDISTDDGWEKATQLRAELKAIATAPRDERSRKLIWLSTANYATASWEERRDLVRKAGIKI